jgi:tRNA-Thr(GGU) m(6)t(6)A37 methyltransferase TsaA
MSGPIPSTDGVLPAFDLAEDLVVPMRPIAVVRSAWKMRPEAPRQGTVDPEATACIVLRPGLQNALKDLAGFSHLWVLAWFHHTRGWNEQLVPPRDSVKRGVFATRSPDRPNPLGLSCVAITRVHGCRIWIRGHDLLDGTPVLDLKPYIPDYDAPPGASRGWLDGLTDPGPDHRLPDPG